MQKKAYIQLSFYNSDSGCSRGEFCSFSHRSISRSIKDDQEKEVDKRVVVPNDEENDKGLGSGKFGWMPGATNHVAAETNDLHGLQVQQDPCQQLQDQEVLQNVEEIDSKEAIGDRDVYDEIIEAMKEGNGELDDEMLDKILEGFENSDNAKKVEERNRVKGGKVVSKKVGKKKVARGRGK